jgi:HEAT repeat protein
MAVANASLDLLPEEVPTVALLGVLRDEERPMTLREAALEAVAHGPRYAAYVEFCKLALSPRHPLWPAAVRQLGRMGDKLAASFLGELTDDELDETQRELRDAALAAIAERGEPDEAEFLAQLEPYMELLTYADLAGGLIRDKAIAELALELRERLHNYELKYELKEVMVQYEAPERLAIGLDGDLWTARLREHCADAISY